MKKHIVKFAVDKKGVAAQTFAISAVPMIGLMGLAVDIGHTYQQKIEIQSALESTALMLAKRSVLNPSMSESELVSAGKQMIAAKTNSDVFYETFMVDTAGVEVKIVASAEADSNFSQLAGQESYTIHGAARAFYGRQDIEISLAVDMTYSMLARMNGKSRLQGAQDAMKVLAESAASGTEDLENTSVKFALVPFDGQVKVWPDSVSEKHFESRKWSNRRIDWNGANSVHDDNLPAYETVDGRTEQKMSRWQAFKNLGSANPSYKWQGCFEARTGRHAFSVATPNPNDAESLYVPYFAPDQAAYNGGVWGSSRPNDYLPDNGPACASASHPSGKNDADARTKNTCKYDTLNGTVTLDAKRQKKAYTKSNPNGFCTNNDPILPLTNNVNKFVEAVDELEIDSSWGVTDQTPGFYWAWNTVTKGFPFNQAKRVDESLKYIVMLSDGANWMRSNRGNNYTYFGYPDEDRLVNLTGIQDVNRGARDQTISLTKSMCDAIHADANGIQVYYIFYNQQLSSQAADVGRHCASTPDHFVHASDTRKLVETFRKIGEDIGRLRLASAD
ncbi:MAG: TadE/TadG family type IV pilus assembly protein [Pseudomonadota bacterium]